MLLREGLSVAPRKGLGQPWVAVARSRCRMRWFRLQQVPQAERLDALRVQAMAWRPFETSAHALQVQGEQGLVIAWDRRAAEQDLQAADCAPDSVRLAPELLLHAPPREGALLVEGAEGFEAQCWQDGQLSASRWWAERPSADDWQGFVQGAGGRWTPLAMPDAQPPAAWLARPSSGWELPQQGGQTPDRWARLMTLGAAAFALMGGMVLAQIVGIERAVAALRDSNAQQRQAMAPLLDQRERALRGAAEAGVWAHWLRAPLPVEVIEHLHESLARRNVQLREMELQGRKIRLNLLPPPQVPRAELLKALQSGGWLSEVTEARSEGRDGVWIEARLNADDAPKRQPEPVHTATAPAAAPAPFEAAPGTTAPALVAPAVRPVSPAPAAPPPPAARPAARTPSVIAMPPGTSASDLPPGSVFDQIK